MLNPDNSTIKSTKRDDYSASSVKSNGPTRAAGDKDFKKILGQKDRGQDSPKKGIKSDDVETEDGEIAMEEQSVFVQKAPPSSIFDFSKNQEEEMPDPAAIMEGAVESPSKLFSRLSNPKADNQEVLSKKGRIPSQFDQEQGDLSSVNPMNTQPQAQAPAPIAPFAPIIEGKQAEVKAPVTQLQRIQSIQAMVNQIVERVDEIRKANEGTTETMITLKNMPIFEGSKLFVTSYDQATKEFNIRFENLTPAAKDLLDMKQYQESLRLSLQEKGYTVHIVTTTTYIETPIAMAQDERLKRDQEQPGGGGQQNKQRQEEEEQEQQG